MCVKELLTWHPYLRGKENPLASIVRQKRAKNPSQESKTRGIDFGRRQTRLKAAMFPDFFRAARSAVAG